MLRRRVPAFPELSTPPPLSAPLERGDPHAQGRPQSPVPPAMPPAPPAQHPAATAPPPGPAGPAVPPRPTAPPTPPGRPAAFRDTAAYHLAHSQDRWHEPTERAAAPPAPEPASATPSVAPGSRPPAPAAGHPPRPPRPRTPPPPQAAGGAPATPPQPAGTGRRPGARMITAAACLVLGIGLLGGAAAGSWLTAAPADGPPSREAAFANGRDAWHNTPVDTLFPRTVEGLGTGPGGADRTWSRIAVAPDGGCTDAYDPRLAQALARAGCVRLLRATYLDATRTNVITVGAQTTAADLAGMLALNTRFSTQNLGHRTDLIPLPYAPKGTPAERFGPAQRASWTVRVLTDLPVVVYAVSGFADGRTVPAPQPAEAATRAGATTAPAESGLGHDAKDLADRVAAAFRAASGIPAKSTESPA
ncbi:Syd protein [Streptomyces sp. NBRC 110611]|nr:Syd protein [Streptomyces sp. NBRC 110611]